MNNMLPFPHLYELTTSESETLWINIDDIQKITYASQNANWCWVYLSGNQTPYIVKSTPDEFYDAIIVDYMKLKEKYGL